MAVIDATDPLIICVGFLEWVLWIEVMICPVLSPFGIYLLYSSDTPKNNWHNIYIYIRAAVPNTWAMDPVPFIYKQHLLQGDTTQSVTFSS